MKKRNWLMTIAFAVLSLTIISTCVIGSTYAKFVSKVGGNGSVNAAGFYLTDGGTLNLASTTTFVGPGNGTAEKTDGAVKFFSQVDTKITVGQTDSASAGTGVFAYDSAHPENSNWGKLVAYYNLNINNIAKAFGYWDAKTSGISGEGDFTGGAVKADLLPTDLIKVGGADTSAIMLKIVDAIFAKEATATVKTKTEIGSTTKSTVDATLAANEILVSAFQGTAAAEITDLNASINWTTLKGNGSSDTGADNNLFDTFVGYCIAKLEAASADMCEELGFELPKLTLALTGSAATNSTFSVSISIKAEQVGAGA